MGREMSNAITKRPDSTVAVRNPMDMIEAALARNVTGEDLQKILDVAERWEANEARKAFDAAMAKFKKDPPVIRKDRTVSYSGTSYKHATHAEVTEKIGEALASVGIFHRFEMDEVDGQIKVTCVLTHEAGHHVQSSMLAAPDTSGSKNSIQAKGSTITYLQRYTLQAATGLSARDMPDDDGRSAEEELVSFDEALAIEALIEEVGADRQKFMKWLGVSAISEIPARHYSTAIKALEKKRAE